MDALKRYRKKVGGGAKPNAATNPFIEMALNKISIHKHVSGETYAEESFDAVLIFRDKEGPDNGILYTYADDGLSVGDGIVKTGSRKEDDVFYLIVEEVKRVDTSVVIRVFNVLETNVKFVTKTNSEKRLGYLLSNLRNSIRTSDRDGISLELKRAVMVVPREHQIALDERLNITNLSDDDQAYSSWLVEGIDSVSTPNINYMHLSQVLKKDFEDIVEPDPDKDIEVSAFDALEFDTQGGYIKTKPRATVLSREDTKVTIQVPMGEGLFIVEVRVDSGDGDPKYKEYKFAIRG